MWEDIVEGFFLETREGLVFDVKQVVQPEDWKVAYVRYVPDPGGPRFRDECFERNFLEVSTPSRRGYRKIYDIHRRYDFLSKNYPEYIRESEFHDFLLQGVPLESIKHVLDPRDFTKFLNEWRGESSLYEDACALVDAISRASGVQKSDIGISGSLLAGLADVTSSDFDVVIYGASSCRKVHGAMPRVMEECPEDGHFYTPSELERHYEFRARGSPVSFQQFLRYDGPKTHQGIWRGRDFFIRYVKHPAECGAKWGDFSHRKLGRCTVYATVSNDEDRIFTPVVYGLSDVEPATRADRAGGEGVPKDFEAERINLLKSFRGRFCEHARIGDRVAARGSLEEVVETKSGNAFYQILVGTNSDDYVVLL
ncbi:MAG: hypothetical protein ACTSU5_20375 [Promethearchaeota archaeon]